MNTNEKKWVALSAVAAVWLAGIAAAVLLAFALNRPLGHPAMAAFGEPRTVEVATPAAAVFEAPILGSALEIDTVWIFGERYQAPARGVEPAPNVARDIADMQCSGWRELQAGSGHVQICE